MKYLRKKCVRCGEEITATFINEEEQIFTCPNCNSISSLFEERDFKLTANAKEKHEDVTFEFIGTNFSIYIERLPSGEMKRSAVGLGVFLIFLIIISSVMQSPRLLALTIMFASSAWIIVYLAYWRLDNRTYEVELSAYQVVFYEKLWGFKRALKSVGSYEIDRIQVVTTANPHNPGTDKANFIIQTKQYQQIKPFYHSANTEKQLVSLKLLMDSYLNIQERFSDIQE